YSRIIIRITHTGLSPTMARLSRRFRLSHDYHWPGPRSLATTCGVSVDVLSSGYLDVSVPQVRHLTLCIQIKLPYLDTWKPKQFKTTRPRRQSLRKADRPSHQMVRAGAGPGRQRRPV